ncbi:protein MpDOXC6 [Marchantia polymorpha subsp. ruderalis]|uniref:Fe2OG dioxygenase domain-containing protein n=2 Tax=Marchantia polymorpha TaxID=3197 RepID=A0A176WFT1_MARPO|nr:hypothetical protein AXG93_4202s1100 [Marchantia polymorpha subsp. ruderalis]PTQ27903.1 hypothetical protein MARPO_0180s0025 [Marchantia polymorpha]BBN00738.1 hypothetical protein Mp_2g01670 [Marchantia polymorpha subsp. ruderalis]|eukprot:PTQ27903.1 hypothetical protein MARPO_0180s0025 [Marchantia polymorpha]
MTADFEIPVIDLTGSEGPEREKLCKELAKACEEWGFFQVINHGIDESLLKRAQKVYTDFFYLPAEEKMKILIPDDCIEGWKHPTLTASSELLKNISGSKTAEYVNSVWLPDLPQHREKWPTSPPALQPTIVEFVHEAKGLHEKILTMIAEGLGLESDAFVKRFLAPRVSVRSNFYPLRSEEKSEGFVHPHSDVSGTTLLLSDMVAGLEVKKDDSWVQVEPRPNGFVVNVGDLVEILSNGKLRSVLHRGLPNLTMERLSIACFYMANNDAVIAPVEELLDDEHPPKYRSIRFEDYFKAFLAKGNLLKRGLAQVKIDE